MESYRRLWIRGLWVFLMLVISNILLGVVAAALGWILRGLIGDSLRWAYVVMMLVIGLPFLGWIFERFASKLPRLAIAGSAVDART